MVNMSTPQKWISLPLLSAGIVLVVLVLTSHAALLKDIRVGEYEDYTRIVFELDNPAEPEKIEIRPSGRLAVVFEDTSAQLIRKIPVDRSPHVDAIQIWNKGNRLIILLSMDFIGFSHKSFSLIDPPRLVLDIHPTEDTPAASAEPSPAVPPAGESTPPRTVSTGAFAPSPQADESAAERPTPQTSEPAPGRDTPKPPVSTQADLSSAAPPVPTSRPISGKRPGRLQFYLMIVLVVITIVILVLLFLMLLTRHRWIGHKLPSTVREGPESPDDEISTRQENGSP
jgi:hypothetical protein